MAEEHTVNGASAPGDTVRPSADAGRRASRPRRPSRPSRWNRPNRPNRRSRSAAGGVAGRSTAVPNPPHGRLPTSGAGERRGRRACRAGRRTWPRPGHPTSGAGSTRRAPPRDGERAVGSWQAGEPVEGLCTSRAASTTCAPRSSCWRPGWRPGRATRSRPRPAPSTLRDGIADAAVVGDLAGVDRAHRIHHRRGRAGHRGEAKKVRDAARAESTARKQALVEEAEKIADESTQWKPAGDRLRAILDEWKTIKGVDRKTDERAVEAVRQGPGRLQPAARFALRRPGPAARRGQGRASRSWSTRPRSWPTPTEWGDTAGRYKDLMVEWKAAGRAPKESDDALWQRFRAAQDKFFARRSAVFDERDAEFADQRQAQGGAAGRGRGHRPGQRPRRRARQRPAPDPGAWDQVGKVPARADPRVGGPAAGGRGAGRGRRRTPAGAGPTRRPRPGSRSSASASSQFEAQAAKARAAGDKRRAKQAEAQAAQWREWLGAAEQAVATR